MRHADEKIIARRPALHLRREPCTRQRASGKAALLAGSRAAPWTSGGGDPE
jgi:hypothetical protein